MVNLFSVYYMANDPFMARFFSYLSFFTFCMLILVTSSDLVQFFIGWELVGICSYLLINFWYTRKQANISAMKAVLVNRVGDFFLLYGICLVMVKFNVTSFIDLNWKLMFLADSNLNYISFLFFIAVMSKSAQFGLHSWLPDAMEGPTPVSALLHAATMVTAGVFLLLRLSTLFELSLLTSKFIVIVGSFTSFFAATTGLAQTDIKKIIAFSTCSQLGYMVAACGFGQFNLAFFHLVTHAFFKSLLFLCAGIVIHTLSGEQDIRKMGGLKNIIPSTYIAMTVASFSLSGIPYLSGFYSKELIVSYSLISNSSISFFSSILLILSAFLTSLYSAKTLYYVFISSPRLPNKKFIKIHSDGFDIFCTHLPLFVLSILSIYAGFFFKEALVGYGSNSLLNTLSEFSYYGSDILWVEFIPCFYKILLFISSIFGYVYYYLLFIGFRNFHIMFNNTLFNKNIYSFFYNRWYFDFVISYFFNFFFLSKFDSLFSHIIQNSFIDNLFVFKIAKSVDSSNASLKFETTLTPQNYLNYTVFSSFFFIFFLTISNSLFYYI